LRRILRQRAVDLRLLVIDDGAGDELLWLRLQGLAREEPALLLFRNIAARGFGACMNLAREQARERDLLVLEPDTRIFPGLLMALARAARAAERVAMLCPLSNRSRRVQSAEWQAGFPIPVELSGKRWAKLVQRVLPRDNPELRAPNTECVWIVRQALTALGQFNDQAGSPGQALDEYAARARAQGFAIRLVPNQYVHAGGEAAGRSSSIPPVAVGSSAGVGELLAWHVRRGTASNLPAPLLLLPASPFASAGADEIRDVERLVRGLHLPRVALAYPAVGGVEVAEVLDGHWQSPLTYRRELAIPLADFVDDVAEARVAVTELLRLLQIGWVHVHGLELWPRVVQRMLLEERVPYCVTVDDEGLAYLEEQRNAASGSEGTAGPPVYAELLSNARRVLCTSQPICEALGAHLGIKAKRRRVLWSGTSGAAWPQASPESAGAESVRRSELVDTVRAAYSACAEHAKDSARRWLSREEMERLAGMRRPRAAVAPVSADPRRPSHQDAQQWLTRLSARIPSVIRSVAGRLPNRSRSGRKSRA
jgi:hypothetical protein